MSVAAGSAVQQRREARLEKRRARIAGAALMLFASRGYTVTLVDEIVARARVSKSAFYEFFESKEHCFREILADEGGALIHEVLRDAATGHNHRERLRLGITRFVLSSFERSDVARLLIVESVGLSVGVERVRHELQARFAESVEEEVRHAAHDPFYADKDPAVFGRAVVGAVSDAVGYYLTHPGAADADSLAGNLCRIFAP